MKNTDTLFLERKLTLVQDSIHKLDDRLRTLEELVVKQSLNKRADAARKGANVE